VLALIEESEWYAIVVGVMVFACMLRWLTWESLEDETHDIHDLDSAESRDHNGSLDHPDPDRQG
jgi:hypothetical protein